MTDTPSPGPDPASSKRTEPPTPPSAAIADALKDLVAECVEAIEVGDLAVVDRLCDQHPHLAGRLRRRLERLREMGILVPPAPERASAPELLPTSIGPYRVLERLGGGGMGVVYLAEQRQPVQRRVAVKVIKPGLDSGEVLARFEAERQALARMNHPHIAQVFDAGTTSDGRPYFAMEYVRGQAIGDWCAQHQAIVTDRLRLFLTVCRAVQHAHQKGVIHRDLKASNLMVAAPDPGDSTGAFGHVKVIDFGIAKAATGSLTEETLFTRFGQLIGTPEYMSPEQARSGGRDVDTRSDVYSLGVVLYELLCGELPFDSSRLRGATPVELEKILSQETPPAPSTRLSTVDRDPSRATPASRVGTPRVGGSQLRRVRGDLDWIVLKALRSDPDDRYASVAQFAADIERHLRNEPVEAGPPGLGYRLRKFVGRHRAAVGAGMAVVASLILGLAMSLWFFLDARAAAESASAAEQRQREALGEARQFYSAARTVIDRVLDRVADHTLVDAPRLEGVRRDVMVEIRDAYGPLLELRPSDPELRGGVAYAMDRLGAIHGNLGDLSAAEDAHRRAIELAEELLAEGGATQQSSDVRIAGRQIRGAALANLGKVVALQGRHEEARAVTAEAVTALGSLVDALRRDQRPWLSEQIAEVAALANLGAMIARDRPKAAFEPLRRALDLLESLPTAEGAASEGSVRRRALHAQVHLHLAGASEQIGDQQRAEQEYRAALAIAVPLLGDHPKRELVRRLCLHTRAGLGEFLRRAGRAREALEFLQSAGSLRRALARDFPSHGYLVGLAEDQLELGLAHQALGSSEDARAALKEAVATCERAAAAGAGSLRSLGRIRGRACYHLAVAALRGGNSRQGERHLAEAVRSVPPAAVHGILEPAPRGLGGWPAQQIDRRAVDASSSSRAPAAADPDAWEVLCSTWTVQGTLFHQRGEWVEAREAHRLASTLGDALLEARPDRVTNRSLVSTVWSNRAAAEAGAGAYEAGCTSNRRALEILGAEAVGRTDQLRCLLSLGECELGAGQFERAADTAANVLRVGGQRLQAHELAVRAFVAAAEAVPIGDARRTEWLASAGQSLPSVLAALDDESRPAVTGPPSPARRAAARSANGRRELLLGRPGNAFEQLVIALRHRAERHRAKPSDGVAGRTERGRWLRDVRKLAGALAQAENLAGDLCRRAAEQLEAIAAAFREDGEVLAWAAEALSDIAHRDGVSAESQAAWRARVSGWRAVANRLGFDASIPASERRR